MLGERTSEEIKMTLGSAFPLPQERQAEVRGRDMVSGLPRTVTVSSPEIRRAIEEQLIERARRDVYVWQPASDELMQAVRLGGRLACASVVRPGTPSSPSTGTA